MKKIVKLILFVFLIVIGIIIVASINHQVQLSKENEDFTPIGDMVEVNGHQMHIYKEGKGEETFVFMAGGGTSSPVLDFKSLYSLLSDQYEIAVVEKAGYGFSEITETKRDIATILSETREALMKAGLEAPYILVPHSMSGIEALYWAQTYPEEVDAIIGLDMAVPAAYEEMEIPLPILRLGQLAANIGLTRWIPQLAESDAIQFGTLSQAEQDLYRLILYRRTSTTNMINEVEHIKKNARLVADTDLPTAPMLLFSSNGEGTGWDKDTWIGFQSDFVSEQSQMKLITLDGPHYIHNHEYERIAEEMKQYIEGL